MAANAFDTLDAARKLKAAGIEVEHALRPSWRSWANPSINL